MRHEESEQKGRLQREGLWLDEDTTYITLSLNAGFQDDDAKRCQGIESVRMQLDVYVHCPSLDKMYNECTITGNRRRELCNRNNNVGKQFSSHVGEVYLLSRIQNSHGATFIGIKIT